MNPIKFSLRYPQVTYVFTAVVVALGAYGLVKMPRREDPKIPFPVALVLAAYPGATAEQVEQQLTRPVEENLFRFAEIRRERTVSTSRPGAMIVWAQLEENVENPELFWAKLRHDLNELRFTSLPQGVLGPIVNSEFGDVAAILLAVQGERYGYRELKDHLRTIEDELRTLPAVSKIKRLGEQREQIYVTSTWERLSQYGVTAFQIIGSLQQKNAVVESGAFETDAGRIPLRTTGLFQAEDQIRRQVVGVSPLTGQPIYLGDFAKVERRYAEPDNMVRVNSRPAMVLSLEMHEGNNIVEFGEDVEARLESLRTRLPPDLEITMVADQPAVVEERISHFLRDFGLAILVVVGVCMMLLPLRVAAIAAGAIPVTVTATFAVMQLLGIELHQVSLAGLIVCLGLVVDDAIVIADSYVDLLDHGMPPEEAAWQAPTQLFVPVLIATFTIVAAFLPMAFLPGDTGNFIWSLPITIAVAMGCSLIVAMLLTPLMCRAFIKEGIKTKAARTQSAGSKRRTPLDLMQAIYDGTINMAMGRKRLTMAAAVLAVAAGGAMFGVVDQQFFPSAERDQFPIKVWMPAGTSLEGTDAAVRRIENVLSQEEDVVSYAAFVGTGAPRFYYNYDPPYDNSNLAEFIVNTTSLEATKQLVPRLSQIITAEVPEAEVIVKELQQGNAVKSPVEVRISGPDLTELKALGAQVAEVFDATPGSRLTRTDFREDVYDVRVQVNDELASRLGLSNQLIAQALAGSLLGAPVSTFWEGDRALDILLRVDESRRTSFDNVRDMTLVSPITGARVPLREVASLEPVWQSSHIIRRNGIRTITIGTDTEDGLLPSALLKRVKAGVEELAFPPGYSMEWGGEIEGQQESFGPMTIALSVSMGIIFMLLLFQFRQVSNVLIIMASIPLSLFGALLGLVLTGNPFGFTAFLGLISLSGVVVRNGIILVEYIEERRAHGVSVEEAALEAGKRRLRPIFLTSFASAVGVLPMIISGSAMWAPLGSVIALGILCSMVFTLVFVPVLYVIVHRRSAVTAPVFTPELSLAATAATAGLMFFLAAVPLSGQAAQRLTMDDAFRLAQERSAALEALAQRVTEQEEKTAQMRGNYLPQLSTVVNYLNNNAAQRITIPTGSFGDLPALGGAFPPSDLVIEQGGTGLFFSTTTLAQPITQLIKIRQGVGVAEADEEVARAGLRRVQGEVMVGTLRLYGGLLIAQVQRQATQAQLATAEERTTNTRVAAASGNMLEVAALEARVAVLQARQKLLEVDSQIEDLQYQLADLLGFGPGTSFELAGLPQEPTQLLPLEEYVEMAMQGNAEVLEARSTFTKAEYGVSAARAEYIPNLGVAVTHFYQSSVPFFPKNSVGLGVQLEWTIWDWGKRSHIVGERRAQLAQADANVRRIEGKVRGDVEKAYRQVAQANTMLELAREAAQLRQEAARLQGGQQRAGFALQAQALAASADALQGSVDVVQAEVGYRLALAELNRAVGTSVP